MYSPKKSAAATYPESDYYYCAGDSKMPASIKEEHKVKTCPENVSHTIFDTPDFVIDDYLDAINGGSSKDAGIRVLSDKYRPHNQEGNTNCNHNPKGQNKPCPGSASNELKANYNCCPGESPYEKGEHHSVEDPKRLCDCEHVNPYEKGESAFVEERKKPSCDCDVACPYEEGESPFKEGLKRHCDSECGSPYESGAFPFKQVNPNSTCDCPEVKVHYEKKVCCSKDEDIDKRPTANCGAGSHDFYSEENCSLCVKMANSSNNNFQDEELDMSKSMESMSLVSNSRRFSPAPDCVIL